MSHIEDANREIYDASRELGADVSSVLGMHTGEGGFWQRMVQEATDACDDTSRELKDLTSQESTLALKRDGAEHELESYGQTVAGHHRGATEALKQGHQQLRRLLGGTNNEHALRIMQEVEAAHEASERADARVRAIGETLSLELALRMQDLLEALGAAANRVYVPFVSSSQLGEISNIATAGRGEISDRATCDDVTQPLQTGFELIDGYRRGALMGRGESK